jgi:hypothetical protein
MPFPLSEEAEPEDLRLMDHKSKRRLGPFLMKKRPSPPQVAAGLAEYAPGGQGLLAASLDKTFMQLMLGWLVLRRGRLILWIRASSFLVVSARG